MTFVKMEVRRLAAKDLKTAMLANFKHDGMSAIASDKLAGHHKSYISSPKGVRSRKLAWSFARVTVT